MGSSYSDLLRLEQMVQGEQPNAWGDITTDNLLKLERGISGRVNLTLASSNVTLSTEDGGDGSDPVDQAGAMILDCDGALSANINIIAPNFPKIYIINNNTTEDYTVSIKTSAGGTLGIPQGEAQLVWCDGDDGFFSITASSSGTVDLATNALQLGGAVAALYALLGVRQTWTKPQTIQGAQITLTAFAYTPDVATDTTMYLAQSEVTADYAINNPSGTPVEGQILIFHLEQHASIVRSITWGTEYIFINDETVDITQTVDTVDVFTCQWNGNLNRWVVAGIAQNLPRA